VYPFGHLPALSGKNDDLAPAIGVLAAIGPTREVASRVTANLTAYHGGFLAAAAVAVIAAAVAFTIHDADAAATIVPRRRGGAVKQAEEPAPEPAGAEI
jgi:hypothetical protein